MKKKSVKVFSLILVSIVIVLILSTTIVSALSFSDVWKSVKSFFGFGEKEKGLEGELRTGPGGSPDYTRVCEEGEKRCELMPSRTANFRYSIKQCQNNVWNTTDYCDINQGCKDGECTCIEGEKRCFEKLAPRDGGIIEWIQECNNGNWLDVELCKNGCEKGECIPENFCRKCPDLNNDGIVNGLDGTILYNYQGEYREDYDLNNDGLVSILSDSGCITGNLNKTVDEIDICESSNCSDGACINNSAYLYLIEKDINVLKYNSTIVNNNCEVLNSVICESHKAVYYPNILGIESVEAIVEVPEIALANGELETFILNKYKPWADDYQIVAWEGTDNVYLFYKKSDTIMNYVIVWPSGDKIVLNKLNNWDTSQFDDNYLEEFIGDYITKYPSGIISEEDKCYWLDNGVRIMIEELETGGERVVLREGANVLEKEFFVTQSGDGGQIWEMISINITGKQVTLRELDGLEIVVLLDSDLQGAFTLRSGQQASLKVYENLEQDYIAVNWPPDSIIDTFYNCAHEQELEPIYIVIRDNPSYEEQKFAYKIQDQISRSTKFYYGEPIENQYMLGENYDGSLVVGVKNNKAIVVTPQYGDAQDYEFALEVDNYLRDLVNSGELSSVCPIINSSGLVNRDIMQSFCIEEGSCASCGLFGLFCGEAECLSLKEGCYFTNIPIWPNECKPCSDLRCSEYLEESSCYSSTCGLECVWEAGKCEEIGPLECERDTDDGINSVKRGQPYQTYYTPDPYNPDYMEREEVLVGEPDRCIDDSTLKEYFCDYDWITEKQIVKDIEIECPNGEWDRYHL